jgi:hypothetical protein
VREALHMIAPPSQRERRRKSTSYSAEGGDQGPV